MIRRTVIPTPPADKSSRESRAPDGRPRTGYDPLVNVSRLPWYALLCASLLAALGATCRTPGEEPSSRAPLPVDRFHRAPTAFAIYSGIGDSLRVIIRDQTSWRSYWALVHAGMTPVPPVPPVDFRRDMVVLAALGRRPSGGFDIVVDSAYLRDGVVEVVVRRTVPGHGCILTAALTQPVDLARIPARAEPVRFEEHTTVEDCS